MRFNTGTCLLVNIEGYTLVLPGCKGWVCCEIGSGVVAHCSVDLLLHAVGHVTTIAAGLIEWVWVNRNGPITETVDLNPAQNGGKNFFSCNAATYDSSPK